jgi:hypothetical protein
MFDLTSLVYGALALLGTLVFFKIIDLILDYFLNKTLFGRMWNYLAKSLKMFMTRLRPIKICFQFRVQVERSDVTNLKERVGHIIESLSDKLKGRIEFSTITWNDTDNQGSVKIFYNKREFGMEVDISTEYQELDVDQMIPSKKEKVLVFSDSLAFSIETNFPFNALDQMLLSLGGLTNSFKDELNDIFPEIRYSKGMFTIAPVKGDLTMDQWIKEKQFEVSLLLKAQDRFLVNLYPKKAEIIFPTVQIDDKVSEYLKATLLNYYL